MNVRGGLTAAALLGEVTPNLRAVRVEVSPHPFRQVSDLLLGPQASRSRAHDHARTEDGHIEAAAQQELCRPPAFSAG